MEHRENGHHMEGYDAGCGCLYMTARVQHQGAQRQTALVTRLLQQKHGAAASAYMYKQSSSWDE